MAAAEGLEQVIAPHVPARHVSYTAPEFGYPGRPCRVCGQRPCVVRLRWWAGACRYAFFCIEHTAAANRACRTLKAGDDLLDSPATRLNASYRRLALRGADVAGFS
jgi:hypothetical protein